ncbi:NADPH-dependent FMN reductase [Cryptosporangium sp. NPDC048952]|uniref:NADPH-dependent FMN reductase n=1 Tax=Cryptosporangium sp. NPDC048952 TaxID=3363961 RepID=UPI0037183DAC
MNAQPLPLAVIVGSTRAGRFGPTVADWFVDQAKQHPAVTIDVIDLALTPLPTQMSSELTRQESAVLADVGKKLNTAEAFVVVTPEYNHSYPAPLKNAIDWHNAHWHAKPVGFVSYGGLAGGLRAVEHLRQVFAELHAVTVRDTVSFHGARQQFDATGRPIDAAGCATAAGRMLDQLVWWGSALSTARSATPYTV